MPPVNQPEATHDGFSGFDGGWGNISMAFLVPVVFVVVIIFTGIGFGPQKSNFKKLCSNQLHEEWLGKTADQHYRFCHPPPRKEVKMEMEIRRCKNPQFCVECVNYAERMLAQKVRVYA